MAISVRFRIFMLYIVGTFAAAGLLSCGGEGQGQEAASAKEKAGLIQPADLVYRGAFRLPDGPDEYGWGWSGQALTWCAEGDAKGPDDGYSGSLFGTGHDHHQYVSEVSIPKPVVSAAKNLDELNTAKTLQDFKDIRAGKFPELEQPRAGLAWLPKQGKQTSGKLYFCFGPHMDETSVEPSHGWCETTLSDPQTAGLWNVGGEVRYVTNDYLFPIDPAWAAKNTPGKLLATGRFRDGGQGSQGPTIFAFGPWNEGDPPAPGAKLEATTLLRYSAVTDEEQHILKDYHHSDEWSGGAWLSAGEKSAVVFVGTKGQGKCWYGFANGVVWPEEGPWPEVPAYPNDQRGWWSNDFTAQMIFYDPADLAAVASGKLKPWEPQPYATLDISTLLYREKPRIEFHHVGDVAFDREHGLLYLIESRGDGDKSLIHVWQVSAPAEAK